MATVTRRAPASSARASKPVKPVSSGVRGAAGLAKMREEQAAQVARKETAQMNASIPFRFFCEAGGESKEIVIVDYTIDEVFWRFEHTLKDKRSGKWNIFTACLNENANCPVCKVAERPSYYAMYLTVIDLTPYVNSEGVTIPWSKKLLVVKTSQQKKITRLAERHEGNLRGMILRMTRDSEKDASIGNDIEFVEFMEEDELLTYETDYKYKRDGKTETKHIVGHEPCDYDAMFPMPTEQQLRAIVGGQPEPGSREDNASQRRSTRSGDDWDDKPARGTPSRSSTRPASRRSSSVIDPDDNPETGADPDDEDAEEETPTTRRRTKPVDAHKPPPARRTTRAAPEPEEEEPEEEAEEEEEEEEAPPTRGRMAVKPAAKPVKKPAAKPVQRTAPRRAAQPDPEEEEDEEEAEEEAETPRRRSAAESLADRRRALRR